MNLKLICTYLPQPNNFWCDERWKVPERQVPFYDDHSKAKMQRWKDQCGPSPPVSNRKIRIQKWKERKGQFNLQFITGWLTLENERWIGRLPYNGLQLHFFYYCASRLIRLHKSALLPQAEEDNGLQLESVAPKFQHLNFNMRKVETSTQHQSMAWMTL